MAGEKRLQHPDFSSPSPPVQPQQSQRPRQGRQASRPGPYSRHVRASVPAAASRGNASEGEGKGGDTSAAADTDVSSRVSGDSNANDAKQWFDKSNRDPMTTLDSMPMDVDPPFFQKETDSSNDDVSRPTVPVPKTPAFPFAGLSEHPSYLPPAPTPRRASTRRSAADDYRSVIDDLTIENKQLKEELKRYRQFASRDVPDKEKLFEIKVHGLPRRKKQELEATLRDFAASLGDSASSGSVSTGSASQRKRDKSTSSRHTPNHPHHHHHHHRHRPHNHLSADSRSKHASISSSRSQRIDSAYASMSAGANSSGTSLVRPSFGDPQTRTSEQKVERYLQDIPEGLHPGYSLGALGDREKKKLIVRRLEQLFTGKIASRYSHQSRKMLPPGNPSPGEGTAAASSSRPLIGRAVVSGTASTGIAAAVTPAGSLSGGTLQQALVFPTEPAREARIQTRNDSNNAGGSRDNLSTSNSNSNGEDSANWQKSGSGSGSGNHNGNGNGDGSANNSANNSASASGLNGNGKRKHGSSSGKIPAQPEQRPTRPRDLDPDRAQVPAENMEYIRHLGLVPPAIGPESEATLVDVSPDVDGWVYLNLLSNLAQLHIFNVAPDFIRKAIVEKSTKLQLSPDGQKIRWRGGMDGTKFSSDGSAGDSSQLSPSTDSGNGSDQNVQRSHQKQSGDSSASTQSSRKRSAHFGQRTSSASSRRFQYKPLFANHHRNLSTLVSSDGSGSQEESPSDINDDDNGGGVGGGSSGSGRGTGMLANKSSSHVGNSAYSMSHSRRNGGPSGSTPQRKRHRANGTLIYYSGVPFCTDLAGESSSDVSPSSYIPSAGQAQDSQESLVVDNSSGPSPGRQQQEQELLTRPRPTIFRSMSGSYLPFRPLTDCMSEPYRVTLDDGEDDSSGVPSSRSDSYQSQDSLVDSGLGDERRMWAGGSSDSSAKDVVPKQPVLEASGLNRVFPEDHFSVLVTTQRPFRQNSLSKEAQTQDDEEDDSDDGSSHHPKEAFNMASVIKRLEALKSHTTAVSGGSGAGSKRPAVRIDYMSAQVTKHAPVSLPSPAVLYPPFSASSDSDEDDDEDESMLASSEDEMISRLPSPNSRHSGNDPSTESRSHEMLSWDDTSDVGGPSSRAQQWRTRLVMMRRGA